MSTLVDEPITITEIDVEVAEDPDDKICELKIPVQCTRQAMFRVTFKKLCNRKTFEMLFCLVHKDKLATSIPICPGCGTPAVVLNITSIRG